MRRRVNRRHPLPATRKQSRTGAISPPKLVSTQFMRPCATLPRGGRRGTWQRARGQMSILCMRRHICAAAPKVMRDKGKSQIIKTTLERCHEITVTIRERSHKYAGRSKAPPPPGQCSWPATQLNSPCRPSCQHNSSNLRRELEKGRRGRTWEKTKNAFEWGERRGGVGRGGEWGVQIPLPEELRLEWNSEKHFFCWRFTLWPVAPMCRAFNQSG